MTLPARANLKKSPKLLEDRVAVCCIVGWVCVCVCVPHLMAAFESPALLSGPPPPLPSLPVQSAPTLALKKTQTHGNRLWDDSKIKISNLGLAQTTKRHGCCFNLSSLWGKHRLRPPLDQCPGSSVISARLMLPAERIFWQHNQSDCSIYGASANAEPKALFPGVAFSRKQ